MSRYLSSNEDERRRQQYAETHVYNDNLSRESDLKWENELRRMCWRSNVSRDLTKKVIVAHKEKQQKKAQLRRKDEPIEEIIIRRDERDRPPYEVVREEIIEHRPVERERPIYRERDEIIIRNDPAPSRDRERDEIIIRRAERSRSPSEPEREIIIRRTEDEEEHVGPRDGRSGRHGEDQKESSAGGAGPAPPAPAPQIITAPTIHQEVITHHRHIQHGFELVGPSKREQGPEQDDLKDAHGDLDAHGVEQEVAVEGSSRSSSTSSSSRAALEPHPIKAPALHQEVITHHRQIDLGDSKADRMLGLLENILQTLRDGSTVRQPYVRQPTKV